MVPTKAQNCGQRISLQKSYIQSCLPLCSRAQCLPRCAINFQSTLAVTSENPSQLLPFQPPSVLQHRTPCCAGGAGWGAAPESCPYSCTISRSGSPLPTVFHVSYDPAFEASLNWRLVSDMFQFSPVGVWVALCAPSGERCHTKFSCCSPQRKLPCIRCPTQKV